ncbi:MAG: HAMP domain-containing protein [Candidatus Electrothrix sp. AW3_4]|nr:HAMP domain-containing protein [Candidatus Electrothrix gigas]
MLTSEQRKQKQRLTRYVIIFCMLLIPLLAYTQRSLLKGELNLPLSSTVLIFALININGLLLLLMLYLILRNLVELIFERKNSILGSRLRVRLVIAFVSLSMIPTIILFLVSLGSVSTAMEYWFNSNVEESLQSSLVLARNLFHETEDQAVTMGNHIRQRFERGELNMHDNIKLQQRFDTTLSLVPLGTPDALSLIRPELGIVVSAKGKRLASVSLPAIPTEALRKAANSLEPEIITRQVAVGELVQAIMPVQPDASNQTNQTNQTFLITTLLIPIEKLALMQSVSKGITDYKQLVILKAPIKLSMIIMLLIITLLILFGAIWFGFFIARSMTSSINKLAQGTQRVADGDLDFTIEKESNDEMGLLVDSFNSMTSDLLQSNRELAETHQALQQSTLISEQRRRYLETILKNVAAGVIAINKNNEVTTINPFAEKLLKIDPTNFLHKDFHTALPRSHIPVIESFFDDLLKSGKRSIERHLNLTVRKGETYSLLVNITRLIDEQGQSIGYVIVFDNLTKLEKAQRLAAWQEVARRIAHEIKNPLTPIQLSAQRLRKRYLATIANNPEIFEQCTGTIISQVDEIKRLVTEFSDFARMPRVKKQQADIIAIAADTLVLYREGHKHINFLLEHDEVPLFPFDPVQIKRVLINLLDNAVSILAHGGCIATAIRLQQSKNLVKIIVRDDGSGMSDQVRQRLFEPYFSTRKSGTGLGLAIAHTIITEHNGAIQVQDNTPSGTVFTIELPFHPAEATGNVNKL